MVNYEQRRALSQTRSFIWKKKKRNEFVFDERTRFIAKCADLKMENYY